MIKEKIKTGLDMTHRSAPVLSPVQIKKKEAWKVMKSPPKDKVVWADITQAKFKIAHPEFILRTQ